MAAAARQDDQGNVVQVGEEGAEGEEGEYQDTKGQGPGDDRGWGAPDPHDPQDPPYGGASGCHPLDPLPSDPMDLLGNLVDALCDVSLQANPVTGEGIGKPCIGMHEEVSCQTLT